MSERKVIQLELPPDKTIDCIWIALPKDANILLPIGSVFSYAKKIGVDSEDDGIDVKIVKM